MNYKPCKTLIATAIAVIAGMSAVASAPTFAASGDVTFLAARDAFRNGERVRLKRSLDALSGHTLQPWAEFWQLRLQLEDDNSSGIPAFLAKNAGSYLADRLRGDWLRWLGKRGRPDDWELFNREWPSLVQTDAELGCYAAQAANDAEKVRVIWTSGQELPTACETLVDRLVAAGGLTVEEVWQRMRRLFEAKKVGAGKTAAAYLPASEGFSGSGLEVVAQNPQRYLEHLPAKFDVTRGGREIALMAVQRLAKSDPQEAARRLARIESQFSPEERAYAWGQVGWAGAMKHLPETLGWYARTGDTTLTDEPLAWWVRAGLRENDWKAVQRAIAAMSPTQAAQGDWSYWQGRAMLALGRAEDARSLFQRIAGQANFYGNLADEELGRGIVVPPRADSPTRDEIAAAVGNPGLQRALALIALDMRVEGIKEWSFALRGMEDRQLLAAAEFAKQQRVWDRAIHAADRTRIQHDFSLRYLAPFRDQVEPKAENLALDGGWVYGLMRQESRFITNAKSAVGAQGLMQVMPATAKWVAKKINLSNFQPHKAAEMETNVTLGTHYLKLVLNSLDNHPVLASAAYNAGPGRAKRWRAERPLEGAIYAETIPFSETRDYVKKVMSNSVYYSALFTDKPQSLKARLGIVRARGQGENNVETLP